LNRPSAKYKVEHINRKCAGNIVSSHWRRALIHDQRPVCQYLLKIVANPYASLRTGLPLARRSSAETAGDPPGPLGEPLSHPSLSGRYRACPLRSKEAEPALEVSCVMRISSNVVEDANVVGVVWRRLHPIVRDRPMLWKVFVVAVPDSLDGI